MDSPGHIPEERRIDEVLSFEELPLGSDGSRRAMVRWSDGTEAEACRWYDDEILICEGELIGKTAADISNLIFRRDRDYLQDE
jgi:hypothetical protein